MQCRIETLGNKRFPNVEDGLGVTQDDLSNLVVRFIGMEQDIGMSDCGGSRFPTVNDAFEERPLVVGKVNGVLALSHDNYI